MKPDNATTAVPSEDAKQRKLWDDFIKPFAYAVGMSVEDVTEKLRPLVGNPDEHAIDALKSEEYVPFVEIQNIFADAHIPVARLRKAVREYIHERPQDKPDIQGALTTLLAFWKELSLNIIALTYVFGLVSWQVYAWLHGFGYVAALNIQYFTSGLCLYLFLGIGVLIMLKVLSILELTYKKAFEMNRRVAEKYKPLIAKAITALNCLLILSLCLFCGLPLCACFMGLYEGTAPWLCVSAAIIGFLYLGYKVKTVRLEVDPDAMNAWLDRMKRNKGTLLFAVAPVLLLYARWGYPNIPQEFGGGRPKLCYIDMDKEKVSDWIIGELVGDYDKYDILSRRTKAAEVFDYDVKMVAPKAKGVNSVMMTVPKVPPTLDAKLKVVHSELLDLWFDSSDYIIVRRHDDGTNKSSLLNNLAKRKVVRIPKNLFMTITIHEQSWVEKFRQSQEEKKSSK